ncbi:hypothetical protein HDZ31DRAFT_64280 [Schizophyllum fasciatum]
MEQPTTQARGTAPVLSLHFDYQVPPPQQLPRPPPPRPPPQHATPFTLKTEDMTSARRASVPKVSFATNPPPEAVLSLFNRVLDRVRVEEDLLLIRENELGRPAQDAALAAALGPLEAAQLRARELDERERHLIEFEASLAQKSHNLRATEVALREWDARLAMAEKRFRDAEGILMERAEQWKRFSHKIMAKARGQAPGAVPSPGQGGPIPEAATQRQRTQSVSQAGGAGDGFRFGMPAMPSTPICIDLTTPPDTPFSLAVDVDGTAPSRPLTASGVPNMQQQPVSAPPQHQPMSAPPQPPPNALRSMSAPRPTADARARSFSHPMGHIGIPHPTSWIVPSAGATSQPGPFSGLAPHLAAQPAPGGAAGSPAPPAPSRGASGPCPTRDSAGQTHAPTPPMAAGPSHTGMAPPTVSNALLGASSTDCPAPLTPSSYSPVVAKPTVQTAELSPSLGQAEKEAREQETRRECSDMEVDEPGDAERATAAHPAVPGGDASAASEPSLPARSAGEGADMHYDQAAQAPDQAHLAASSPVFSTQPHSFDDAPSASATGSTSREVSSPSSIREPAKVSPVSPTASRISPISPTTSKASPVSPTASKRMAFPFKKKGTALQFPTAAVQSPTTALQSPTAASWAASNPLHASASPAGHTSAVPVSETSDKAEMDEAPGTVRTVDTSRPPFTNRPLEAGTVEIDRPLDSLNASATTSGGTAAPQKRPAMAYPFKKKDPKKQAGQPALTVNTGPPATAQPSPTPTQASEIDASAFPTSQAVHSSSTVASSPEADKHQSTPSSEQAPPSTHTPGARPAAAPATHTYSYFGAISPPASRGAPAASSKDAPAASHRAKPPFVPKALPTTAPTRPLFTRKATGAEGAGAPKDEGLSLRHLQVVYTMEGDGSWACRLCAAAGRRRKFGADVAMPGLAAHVGEEHPMAAKELLAVRSWDLAEMRGRLGLGAVRK